MPEMRLRMETESKRPEKLPPVQDAAGYSPEGIMYKLCKRGHVRSPENVNRFNECLECKKLYKKTEKCKTQTKSYQQSAKYIETRKVYTRTDQRRNSESKRLCKYKKRSREVLTDAYIANELFRVPTSLVPKEIIELKRAYILLKRELKKCKQSDKC